MESTWIFSMDEECRTPLDRASQSEHMALTELLLRQEATDSLASLEGSSVTHIAAYLGLHEAIVSLINEGGNINIADQFGETPLHKAAKHGHYEAAKLLIDNGANVNVVNHLGLTPLHWVALNGQALIAELLVSAGADPNLANECLDGLTPLQLAKIMGYESVAQILER